MPCSFSYTGTTPATVVNFLHNPQMGEWKHTQKWMSPALKAAAGEDAFVFDKAVIRKTQSLHWGMMYVADFAALLLFLDVVDGISKLFNYIDPAGAAATARIWNAQEIKDSLMSYGRTDITVELLIECQYYYLTDESGNHLTDDSDNRLLATQRF